MSQALSPGRFVSGIELTPTNEPELTDTVIAVKDPPKKSRKQAKRSEKPAIPAEPKARPLYQSRTVSHPAIREITTPAPLPRVKKIYPRPQTVAEVTLDLSGLRMNSFCKSVHISTDQPLKMSVIDAWTSNGHTMFRAIGDTFEAIFKNGDTPLMTRMLVYAVRTVNDEGLTFPVKEPFFTPDEIAEMFADRTLRVSK